MKLGYKKLGDYIQLVDERNKNLEVETLLGLSMRKEFRKSTSNVVGTDMANYKIVRKDRFACDFMSVIRVFKLPVVLQTKDEAILVSPAYSVFEVIDKNVLVPEYLMLWFRRSEFDRYCFFKCDSAVRGGFNWTELCETEVKIPSLEKQKELIVEYEAIESRIQLNKKLCATLEETAQTIYKHWFEDFEFPDENGKPYQSSGGEMVECEELGKEIPKGWKVTKLGKLCTIKSSKRVFEKEYKNDGVPFYRGKEISQKRKGSIISDIIYISENHFRKLVEISGRPLKGDILITAVGTVGNTYMVKDEKFYFKDGNIIWLCEFENIMINSFIYWYMQTSSFMNTIQEIMIGSTQKAITINTLSEIKLIIPSIKCLNLFADSSYKIKNKVNNLTDQVEKLEELKSVLLGKMAVEN